MASFGKRVDALLSTAEPHLGGEGPASQTSEQPAFPAASNTTRESSAICALTSFDGDVIAFAVQTRRPLGTSVTRPFAE
jgi:hypothetical protein